MATINGLAFLPVILTTCKVRIKRAKSIGVLDDFFPVVFSFPPGLYSTLSHTRTRGCRTLTSHRRSSLFEVAFCCYHNNPGDREVHKMGGSVMPREATLFDEAGGSAVRAFLLL